jgi:hypothetical protein
MGTTVTYEPPTATDYFLKSVACTPDSENLFALCTTEVTYTTKTQVTILQQKHLK